MTAAERYAKASASLARFRALPRWRRILGGGTIAHIILATIAEEAEWQMLRQELERH